LVSFIVSSPIRLLGQSSPSQEIRLFGDDYQGVPLWWGQNAGEEIFNLLSELFLILPTRRKGNLYMLDKHNILLDVTNIGE
jgi:hypothetical protein